MEEVINLIILTLLEIVLGIDNILFISIVVQNVKRKQLARYIGLSLALFLRLLMLVYIRRLLTFDLLLFHIPVKNVILGLGGLFLIIKSIHEVYKEIFCSKDKMQIKVQSKIFYAILQIIFIDLVFSIDSVLTAIALTQNIPVIVVAFSIAMFVMLVFSKYSIQLLEAFPRFKILFLVFIFGVGFLLAAESMNFYISRGYLYVAFIFSFILELLNIKSEQQIDKNKCV